MKISGISICFAVFAATIMLMTTCIAQPIQAEVTMDAIESAEQELMSSVEAMNLKMEKDLYLKNLGVQISKDTKINSIVNAFKNTDPEDYNTQLSLAKSLSDYLPKMQAYLSFKNYFERSYSYYINTINTKANELMSLSNQYQNNIVNSPEADAVPVIGSATDGYYSSDSGLDMTSSTKVSLIGDKTCTPEATEPDLAGFLRNMNGDIYVPGYGWVSPTDPNYNYFLSLETYLHGSNGYLSYSDLQDWIVFILLWLVFFTFPGYIAEVVIIDIFWIFVWIVGIMSGIWFPSGLLILLSPFMSPLYYYFFYYITKYPDVWPPIP